MAVDISVSPYYDDFEPTNNYVKVLFKPGVAVQARELTQIQSILQNQVNAVGGYIFKDGSKVSGPKPIINLNCRTIRLKTVNARGESINVQNFLNTYVTSSGSTVLGFVEFVYEKDDPIIGDPPSIVISLKRFNSTNDGMFDEDTELSFYKEYSDALNGLTPNYTATTTTNITKNASATVSQYSKTIVLANPNDLISVGDLVTHPAITKKIYVTEITSTTQLEVNESPGVTFGGETISFVTKASNPTSIFSQDQATFFKNGYFVTNALQSIVPDKRTSFPSRFIAFSTDQEIITSDDDQSLLDPALESSNYFADGADRLKVNLNLISLDLTEEPAAEDLEFFLPLMKLVNGRIEYITEVEGNSELDKKLAERTYDESGSYVVNDFKITPEYLPEYEANLRFSISAGKAYVGGYKVQTIDSTQITIPKAATTETKTNFNINTTYGNYFKVANVRYSLLDPSDLEAAGMFLELHNVTNPANANSLVGIVAFKSMEYDSFTNSETAPQYKFFYHYYSPVKEVPATWSAWATKYKKNSTEGQYIANVLYTSGNLLGQYGTNKANYYGLFREPDTAGVAYWHSRWVALGKDIAKVKQEFALSFTNPNSQDYSRVRSNSKTYLEVINGSPFFDGLLNVKAIRSIVGVGNKFTEHSSSASYASPFFYANISTNAIDPTTNNAVIFDTNRGPDTLIYPTTKTYVKTVDRIQTQYIRTISNAIFVNGAYTKVLSTPETFAIGDGIIPSSTARTNFTVLVKGGATGNVPLGAFNFENGSVTISGDASTATIDTGDATFTGIADIYYRVENDDTQPRTKTLVTNRANVVNIQLADYKYSLGKSDIVSFSSLYKLANVTKYLGDWNSATSYDYNDIVTFEGSAYLSLIPSSNASPSLYANTWTTLTREDTAFYVLDNGQRDTFYDHGSISYIGSATPPGNVIVIFNYYTHTGDGPITVNSYPDTDYDKIPIYRSVVTGREINLRDSLDFRPRRVDDTIYQNYASSIIPISDSTTEVDVTYYIGRKDRIYVTNSLQNFASPYNKFFVQIGSTALNPEDVKDDSDLTKLSIATLEIPPYARSSFDVKIVYDENKRFTMKDIAKLENMTYSLDKAIKLQAVEINTLRGIITNDDGEALLKSGILVENFDDYDTADVQSNQFVCAIDVDEQLCFPSFGAWNVDLTTIPDQDIFKFNDIITMKYEEELYITNLKADSELIVNPAGISDGKGRAEISKKNSFRVNLLLSGGLLLAGSIAYKTAQAMKSAALVRSGVATLAEAAWTLPGSDNAIFAAFQSESVLATAWGAVKDLGVSLLEGFKVIDGIMEHTVGWPYTAVKQGFTWIYDKLSGNGVSELVPSASSAGAVNATIFGESAWSLYSSSFTYIKEAASFLTNGNYALAGDALSGAFTSFSQGVFQSTWGTLALGADKLAAFTVNALGQNSILSQGATWLAGQIGIQGSLTTWLASAGWAWQAAAAIAAVYVVSKVGAAVWNGVKSLASKAWSAVKSLFSDIRMKTNIIYKGIASNGLKIYEYEYKKRYKDIAGHGRFIGFMAHEVEKKYPKAVTIERNGFKSVDYSLIGS